jgi:hypothetical protein
MKFHAQVAELAHAPTEFRLLNGSAPVVIGRGDDNGQNLSLLNTLFNQVSLSSLITSILPRVPEAAPRSVATSEKSLLKSEPWKDSCEAMDRGLWWWWPQMERAVMATLPQP